MKIMENFIFDLPNPSVTPSPPPDPPPSPTQDPRQPHTHKFFYKNQFSHNYKLDEQILQQIIKNNTTCHNPEDALQLITSATYHFCNLSLTIKDILPQISLLETLRHPPLKKLT